MSGYNHRRIEKKWQEIWLKKKIYEPNLAKAKNPFYNLMMFPYPSAEGLHIGNMYAFVGSDIYGRYQKMKGRDVFEPIGLDGFGIHSENYALKINRHPMRLAKKTEKNFYRQLHIIGNGFSWQNQLETYDPEYYKWTQWIFIQMFKNGLAYRRKAEVNWCPSCKTVLADEQVISGQCERSGHEVVKKELEQWFFRITKYADKLLDNLGKIDWSERVKIAQKNWIGKSEGAEIKFKIFTPTPKFGAGARSSRRQSPQATANGGQAKFKITVFTTRPDTIFGATFMVLAPEHKAISHLISQISNFKEAEDYLEKAKKKTERERISQAKEKTGVELKGIKAVNPASGEEISVWLSDYVLAGYGTGAIMAVPAHDQRDFEFAKKFNRPIKMVVCPNYPKPVCPVLDKAYEGEGYLVDSGRFDGMPSEKAKKEITQWLAKKGLAKKKITYRLRDWLISRQRYWGPPIPLVFCENCAEKIKNFAPPPNFGVGASKNKEVVFNKGEWENPGWIAVPEKKLPVILPYIKNFRPTGTEKSPLATVKSFHETKCPKCKGRARRETDVSDTFLDSAWYYFRYIDAKNNKKIFDKKIMERWLPVDMYIGGAEHSVLHLLYSRFLTKVFYDLGLIGFDEPFEKFRAHGLIIREGAKMSKSKGNIVNPDAYIEKFGADTIRMYLMFLGPFKQGGDFRDSGIAGLSRFLNRVYKLKSKCQNPNVKINPKLDKLLHQSIKKITEDIENLRFNTAISQLMIFLNEIEKTKKIETKSYKLFLKLLAPFAPYLAEELWHQSGGHSISSSVPSQVEGRTSNVQKKSIHLQEWPKYDSKKIKEEIFELVVEINGKMRDRIKAPAGITQEAAEDLAKSSGRTKKFFKGRPVKRIVFVPGRLINFVLV